jgi:hypothetical protein
MKPALSVVLLCALAAACGGGGGGGGSGGSAPPASQPAWVEAWSERWTVTPAIGIEIDHPQPDCKGSRADPDVPPYDAFTGVDPNGAQWATIGAVEGWSAGSGRLRVTSNQFNGGWALNSYASFDAQRPLRLSGTIALQPDRGAWIGLALIVDEADYREIALYEQGGALHAGIWAPCYIRPLAPVAAGERRVTLEYTPPPAEICWRFYVDQTLLAEERCDRDGAPLRARPRVGLYVVNLLGESLGSAGVVRAELGALTVESR